MISTEDEQEANDETHNLSRALRYSALALHRS